MSSAGAKRRAAKAAGKTKAAQSAAVASKPAESKRVKSAGAGAAATSFGGREQGASSSASRSEVTGDAGSSEFKSNKRLRTQRGGSGGGGSGSGGRRALPAKSVASHPAAGAGAASTAAATSKSLASTLSNPLLRAVLLFLLGPEACAVAGVNKHWHECEQPDLLWRREFERHFLPMTGLHLGAELRTWRARCQRRCALEEYMLRGSPRLSFVALPDFARTAPVFNPILQEVIVEGWDHDSMAACDVNTGKVVADRLPRFEGPFTSGIRLPAAGDADSRLTRYFFGILKDGNGKGESWGPRVCDAQGKPQPPPRGADGKEAPAWADMLGYQHSPEPAIAVHVNWGHDLVAALFDHGKMALFRLSTGQRVGQRLYSVEHCDLYRGLYIQRPSKYAAQITMRSLDGAQKNVAVPAAPAAGGPIYADSNVSLGLGVVALAADTKSYQYWDLNSGAVRATWNSALFPGLGEGEYRMRLVRHAAQAGECAVLMAVSDRWVAVCVTKEPKSLTLFSVTHPEVVREIKFDVKWPDGRRKPRNMQPIGVYALYLDVGSVLMLATYSHQAKPGLPHRGLLRVRFDAPSE